MSNRVYPKAVTDREFETITPSPHFPAMEESVLKYWDVDDTFRRSIAQRDSGNANDEFVFFDGPPFANGLPHYGH